MKIIEENTEVDSEVEMEVAIEESASVLTQGIPGGSIQEGQYFVRR